MNIAYHVPYHCMAGVRESVGVKLQAVRSKRPGVLQLYGHKSDNTSYNSLNNQTRASGYVIYIYIYIYGPPQVDRIWGIWGSYYNIPQAIFALLKGDYNTTFYEF